MYIIESTLNSIVTRYSQMKSTEGIKIKAKMHIGWNIWKPQNSCYVDCSKYPQSSGITQILNNCNEHKYSEIIYSVSITVRL